MQPRDEVRAADSSPPPTIARCCRVFAFTFDEAKAGLQAMLRLAVGWGKQQPTGRLHPWREGGASPGAGGDTAASAVTHAPPIRPISWAPSCAVHRRGRSISSELETDSTLRRGGIGRLLILSLRLCSNHRTGIIAMALGHKTDGGSRRTAPLQRSRGEAAQVHRLVAATHSRLVGLGLL